MNLRRFVVPLRTLALVLSVSCALSIHARAQTNVLTNRYDNNRSGANLTETILNPSTVNPASFAKLWSYSVDGAIFAQPLYVKGVAVTGQASPKNVLYVVTMHDVVYAFDADNPSGPLWTHDYRSTGVTPGTPFAVNAASDGMGIVSTPVIDAANSKMYLVTETMENSQYVQRVHILDIRSGIDLAAQVITGSANGETFNPMQHTQRPGLALADGQVWLAFGSTIAGDYPPWHGWVMTYDATTLAQTGVFVTGTGTGAGIWQSGAAPAVDAAGNVYYLTGNSEGDTYDGVNNFQESLLQFNYNGGLKLKDWYTSSNWFFLDGFDQDLSASAPLLIPGTSLVAFGQKWDVITVLDTNNLGKLTGGDSQAVQEFSFDPSPDEDRTLHLTYWQRTGGPLIYAWPEISTLTSYSFNGSTMTLKQKNLQLGLRDPATATSISANGGTPGSGILWAGHNLVSDADVGQPAVVEAYNADNIGSMLWSSTMNLVRDDMAGSGRFVMPLVNNGKMYMATAANRVHVYGLWASTIVTNPPSTAVACAVDYQSCLLPATVEMATIFYGAGSTWAVIPGISGSVTCLPGPLGVPDPAYGIQKTCKYVAATIGTPPAATGNAPPSLAVTCAVDSGACNLPTNITASVYYGAGTSWTVIPNRSGSFTCSAGSLGVTDPAPNVVKSCEYVANPVLTAPPAGAVNCAVDYGTCTLPAGKVATVYYGASRSWYILPAKSGSFNCLNSSLGVVDPTPNVQKSCRYTADSVISAPPAGSATCAVDYGLCTMPPTQSTTIYYGAGQNWTVINGVSGNFTCLNTAFGIADPAPGVQKSCSYIPPPAIAPPGSSVACAVDYGTCALPAGVTATIYYGTNNSWDVIPGQTSSFECTFSTLGITDPAPGVQKSCRYSTN